MGKFPTFLIPFFPFTRLQPVELGFRLATFERVCEEDFAFAPPSPPAPPRFPRATRHSRSLAIADLPAPSLPASTTSWPPPRRFRARSAAVLARSDFFNTCKMNKTFWKVSVEMDSDADQE